MIRLDSVSKVFGTGVAGLSDITLLIEKGEFVFLVGHTGSGKTTLLRLLVRDMLPTQGTIVVSDFDVVKLPNNKVPALRKKVGVIFQDLKLLIDRTILENIILPMQVGGIQIADATKRAEELLQMVGLSEHRDKFPVQLSGGELQRVAIARALSLSPEILLADEPTGNLDPQTAQEIVDLLMKINDMGTTIIMATHNLEIVDKMKKRVIKLDKGKLIGDDKKHQQAKDNTQTKEKNKEEKKELPKVEQKSESSEEITVKTDVQKNEEHNDAGDKTDEHKKEAKKLSDLLAKARQTLHKKDKEEKELDNNMPFGFEKEVDIKEIKEDK